MLEFLLFVFHNLLAYMFKIIYLIIATYVRQTCLI